MGVRPKVHSLKCDLPHHTSVHQTLSALQLEQQTEWMGTETYEEGTDRRRTKGGGFSHSSARSLPTIDTWGETQDSII